MAEGYVDRLQVGIPADTFTIARAYATHLLGDANPFSEYARQSLRIGFRLEQLGIAIDQPFSVNGDLYTPPRPYVPGQPEYRRPSLIREIFLKPDMRLTLACSTEREGSTSSVYVTRRLELANDLVEFGVNDLVAITLATTHKKAE